MVLNRTPNVVRNVKDRYEMISYVLLSNEELRYAISIAVVQCSTY